MLRLLKLEDQLQMVLIGELQVPLQELKIKEAVDHVGHSQLLEP
jgi:hypothetical protein